ncbi:MAG: hypothetical protein WAM66_14245 [Acidobacteriaceae bacterium]
MWDKAAVIANFMLVMVGGTGVIVAWRTLRKIKEQTEAGRKAAEAALLNAQAVINAERAALLFLVTKERVNGPPPRTIFKITVKNFGRVPAWEILVSESQEKFVRSPGDLLPSPRYEYSNQTSKYLVPGEALAVVEFDASSPGKHNQRAQEGIDFDPHSIQTVIFGEVIYKDGVSGELRHSRFCFGHDRWPFSNVGGSAASCGPEVYRECT